MKLIAHAAGAALAALAKNLGVVGHNARVTWGSYTGAGTYGASNQNSLEFGFCPVLVAITCDELGHYPAAPSILLRGAGLAPTLTAASGGSMGAEYTALRPTWGDSGVSWSMLSSATTKPKKRNKKQPRAFRLGAETLYDVFLGGYANYLATTWNTA